MDIELRTHDNNVVLSDDIPIPLSIQGASHSYQKPMKNVSEATSCFMGSHGCSQTSTNDTTTLYIFLKIECHGIYRPTMTIIYIDHLMLNGVSRMLSNLYQ